jgi:hypothetical protein
MELIHTTFANATFPSLRIDKSKNHFSLENLASKQ